jgi:hypothetical protein
VDFANAARFASVQAGTAGSATEVVRLVSAPVPGRAGPASGSASAVNNASTGESTRGTRTTGTALDIGNAGSGDGSEPFDWSGAVSSGGRNCPD